MTANRPLFRISGLTLVLELARIKRHGCSASFCHMSEQQQSTRLLSRKEPQQVALIPVQEESSIFQKLISGLPHFAAQRATSEGRFLQFTHRTFFECPQVHVPIRICHIAITVSQLSSKVCTKIFRLAQLPADW